MWTVVCTHGWPILCSILGGKGGGRIGCGNPRRKSEHYAVVRPPLFAYGEGWGIRARLNSGGRAVQSWLRQAVEKVCGTGFLACRMPFLVRI